jgi:hypothetical protein
MKPDDILCEFSDMIQDRWMDGSSSLRMYMEIHNCVKDSMNVFHEADAFILMSLHILDTQ